MKEIVYVIFFSVLVISYLYSGMYIYNNYGKELEQISSTYIIIFFVMYVCLFLTLSNIVVLSIFYNIVNAWSRKLIVFYGGKGKSANCNNILLDVECIYPRAC